MSIRNLDRVFAPRSVALIGATDRPGSAGAVILRNLRRAAFPGEILLVNPHRQALGGLPVYPDIASLPHPPDLAIIATRPPTVPGIVAALGRRGTAGAVIVTAGFDVANGEAGPALLHQALVAARPHLLRVIGPNCVGIIVPERGLDASLSPLAPPAGDIAFVAQSGAMVTAMLDWAAPRGIGFSHVVSLGDTGDVDLGDMLDHLAGDRATRAILLYAEHLAEGRKFMSAARAAARAKPVLILKADRTDDGADDAAAQSAMLAGADAVCDAAFRRAGVLRVARVSELFEAAETLALTREQAGDRLVIVTNGGGAGVLATDALAAAERRPAALKPATIAALDRVLPPGWSRRNPIEFRGDPPGACYAAALGVLLADRDVDAVLIVNCPTALALPEADARAVIDAVAAAPAPALRGRNIFTAWLGQGAAAAARAHFAAARLPSYETPEAAVAGFLHRIRHQRNRTLLMETPPARPGPFEPDVAAVRRTIAAALAGGQTRLAGAAAAAVLAAYGIAAANTAVRPPDAVALFAGLATDPVFGPVVVFGSGGAAPEITADSAIELPPLNLLLAHRLIARTRVSRRLRGDHRRPPAAVDAVAEVLIRLGQLAGEHPEIRTLDINPLWVDATGAVAQDACFDIAESPTPAPRHLAIAPYPREFEGSFVLRDGSTVTLRPLRPEDEPLLLDLAAHMNPDDLRLRFFTPMHGISHALAARLTQLDYDREMALTAQQDGATLGIARFYADPDRRAAEFAIAVRSDAHGRGVGHLLMTRLIAIARNFGIAELTGEVLRENTPMLEMCSALGFAVTVNPDDPAVLHARLPLAAR